MIMSLRGPSGPMSDTTQVASCAVLHSPGRQAARNYNDPSMNRLKPTRFGLPTKRAPDPFPLA